MPEYARYKTIRFLSSAPIAWIVLNRPRSANLVNMTMALEIREVVQHIREDDGFRVAIVTGAGKVFSVGREGFPRCSKEPPAHWIDRRRVAMALSDIEIPSIAAINGDAIDHGLELALACDIRVASRDALLGVTDLSKGLLPWDGATQRLPRLIGPSRALDMLLTSRLVSAAEARCFGLVSSVVMPGDLSPKVLEMAQSISQGGPIANRYVKEAVRTGLDMSLQQGLRVEGDLNIILQSTSDREEGIRSFMERRPPTFTGQ